MFLFYNAFYIDISSAINKSLAVITVTSTSFCRPQLYDIMGYVQTLDAHEGVMKKLHFEKKNHEEYSERYLWALSISPQPNPDIINDLLRKYRKLVDIPEKVKETLVLTMASMAYRLQKVPHILNKQKVNTVYMMNLHSFGKLYGKSML